MRRFMDGDPQQFWKNENLYASVKPFHNSQKVLEILNNSYDIRFYSDSHPEHRLSKLRWIDNHYPYHCGLNHVIAEEKPLYAGDVWVEDRTDTVESLTQSQPGATIFHMVNDINRKSIVFGAIRVDNWTEIGRHLV
jgi:5'(3')-deoxyribonucleotidase